MPQLIQSMRIVGTPWCRCNQSETATRGTNSIEIIVLPFWKWMNTYGYSQVSWNPEPTSCNFKAHVVAASKNVLAHWATFSGANCPPALQPSPQDSATSEPRRPGIGAKVWTTSDIKEMLGRKYENRWECPNWFNQWESLEHLDAVATSLKLQPVATNSSLTILKVDEYIWILTCQLKPRTNQL